MLPLVSAFVFMFWSSRFAWLLCVLVLYPCGVLLAYVTFLLDRRAAIRSVHRTALAATGVDTGVRAAGTTAGDSREALIASTIWPVLLLGTLGGPLWVAAWRYLDRRSKANLRRLGFNGSMTIGDLVQDTSEQDRTARLLVLVAGVGKVRLIARSGDIAQRGPVPEGASPQPDVAYVGEVEVPFRPPARRGDTPYSVAV